MDGRFRSGPLHGRAVHIKWYRKREGLVDMSEADQLEYYLVRTGPPSTDRRAAGFEALR